MLCCAFVLQQTSTAPSCAGQLLLPTMLICWETCATSLSCSRCCCASVFLQVHQLVTACPAILSEKPLELQRKVDFLCATLNMELGDCLAHPMYLGASLMQVRFAVSFTASLCQLLMKD
jgi:hypothetical protein